MGWSLVGSKQIEAMEAAERGDAFGRRTFIPTKDGLSEAYTSTGILKRQAVEFGKRMGFLAYVPTEQTRVVKVVLTPKGAASLANHRKRAA